MSKGPGHVMRGVLEALGFVGWATTKQLAGVIFTDGATVAALVSTRRALRALVRRGLVTRLGFNLSGGGVYCLTADRALYVCPWATPTGAASWRATFGAKHHRYLVGLWYSGKSGKAVLEGLFRDSVG